MDTFRAAVFALLNGDSTLTDMLATTTSIYHRRAPLNAAFPFIIFQQQSGTPIWSFQGSPVANKTWLFKGIDRGASASKAEDIRDRMDTVLTNATLTLSSGELLYLRRESDVDYEEDTDPDLAIHHVGGVYRVIIDT